MKHKLYGDFKKHPCKNHKNVLVVFHIFDANNMCKPDAGLRTYSDKFMWGWTNFCLAPGFDVPKFDLCIYLTGNAYDFMT